ncbi:MAG: HDIG domain-containing metalloprotein [Clostridiaceae bacterium]
MYSYKIKQFIWAIFAKINYDDKKYVRKILNKKEEILFLKMTTSEQKHSIRVSKAVEKELLNNKEYDIDLVKSALLHDIGKIKCKMNTIEKSFIIIFNKLTKGKIKNKKIKNKINLYYKHGDLGCDILKAYGYSDKFYFYIKNHNNKNIDDYKLNILKKYDNMY